MSAQRRTNVFLLIIVLILGLAGGRFLLNLSTVSFVSSFEGQDTRLVSWDASNFDPTRATTQDANGFRQGDKTLDGTHAIIDPDGKLVKGWIDPCEHGCATGLDIRVFEPVPINYEGGKYKQVYSQPDWRPSEEWEVLISGKTYEIGVYRMITGLTVTTVTSRPEEGTDEDEAIRNVQIKVLLNLPTWRGVEDAFVGIGNVYIPNSEEVAGTNYAPAVTTELIGYEWRGMFSNMLGLGIDFNEDPYISPSYAPGAFLHGAETQKGNNPVGAPESVTLSFEWASIRAGVQDTGPLAEQRVEVTEALQIIVVFMAARPLYVAAAQGGAETPAGGVIQPPLICNALEDPIYNSADEIIACQPKDILGQLGLLITLFLMAIIVIAVAVVLYLVIYRRRG